MLIDPEGYAVWGHSGEITFDELDGVLRRAVPFYRRQGLLARRAVAAAPRSPPRTPPRPPSAFRARFWPTQAGGRLIISDSGHNRILVTRLRRLAVGDDRFRRVGPRRRELRDGRVQRPAGTGSRRGRPLRRRHVEPPHSPRRSGRQAGDHDRRHRTAEPPAAPSDDSASRRQPR